MQLIKVDLTRSPFHGEYKRENESIE